MKTNDKKIQAVIFDIDGVLVDTRPSYLEAICITTELYLTRHLAIQKKGAPLLNLKDVEEFKMLGGFNNDWDCVEGLLYYSLSLIKSKCKTKDISICFPNYSLQKLKKMKNIPALLKNKSKKFLKEKSLGKFISYPKIVNIFQEVYLGKEIYKMRYKKEPVVWKKKGLYLKERQMQPIAFFEALKKQGLKLAIATGRDRFETAMILERLKLSKIFDSIITADETLKAEKKQNKRTGKKVTLSKPNPYVLVANAKKLKVKRFAYIGDLPDDIKAGEKANKSQLSVKTIGFLKGVSDQVSMRREMKSAGAYKLVKTTKELIRILEKL